jgi:FKBP-type peptidyl-prolyl cis-trans isomerase FkpA
MCGCFEIADLVKSIGTEVESPDPSDDADDAPATEEPFGPFRPGDEPQDNDAADNGDDDATGDDTDDGDGDDDDADDAEPTLEPLPPGAVPETLESGLQVHDFEVGTGDQPQSRQDAVRVDYAGYIQDTGRRFDSGEDVRFSLSGVIDGFAEGILGMRVGGQRRIIIPPDLGYGPSGNAGAGIAGDDVIVFDVTLLAIE